VINKSFLNLGDDPASLKKREKDALISKKSQRSFVGFAPAVSFLEFEDSSKFSLWSNNKSYSLEKRYCVNDGKKVKKSENPHCGVSCCNFGFKDIRDALKVSKGNLRTFEKPNNMVAKCIYSGIVSDFGGYYLSSDILPSEIIYTGCDVCDQKGNNLGLSVISKGIKILNTYHGILSPICYNCTKNYSVKTIDLYTASKYYSYRDSNGNIPQNKEDLYWVKFSSIESFFKPGVIFDPYFLTPDHSNSFLELLKSPKSSVLETPLDSLTILNVEAHKSDLNPKRTFDRLEEFFVYQNLLARDESTSHFYDFSRFDSKGKFVSKNKSSRA